MILIDTHVLVNSLIDPDKLGPKLRSRIEEKPSVYYSSLSIAEITLKALKLKQHQLIELPKQIASLGFVELPFTAKHATTAEQFKQLFHSDPFDWMLLSQAASEECNFYTKDMRLLGLGFSFTKDATD